MGENIAGDVYIGSGETDAMTRTAAVIRAERYGPQRSCVPTAHAPSGIRTGRCLEEIPGLLCRRRTVPFPVAGSASNMISPGP